MVKGKGKAVTATPGWVWEGLAAHAPESAQLACRAADASSAARYFEVRCKPYDPLPAHALECVRMTLPAEAAEGK